MITYQNPNKELVTLVVAFVIAILTHGLIHELAEVIYVYAGSVWSYQEITDGDSWFRVVLGVIVALGIAIHLYMLAS